MITKNGQPKNDSDSIRRTRTRTEIHVETHEVFVIRSLSEAGVAWCQICGLEVRILTPEQAAVLVQTTPREIYRRIENGSQHAVETADGATLVCCGTGQDRYSAPWQTE